MSIINSLAVLVQILGLVFVLSWRRTFRHGAGRLLLASGFLLMVLRRVLSFGEPTFLKGVDVRAIGDWVGLIVSVILMAWLFSFRRMEADLTRAVDAVSRHEQLLGEIFDAIPSHAAILDTAGDIILTNAAWKTFAGQGGLEWKDEAKVNYIQAAGLRGKNANLAERDVASGIENVLRGQVDEYFLEYPCRTPQGPRWFTMRVRRLARAVQTGAIVLHDDVTLLKATQESLMVADHMPGMVGYWDSDLRCKYANNAYLSRFNRGPEQMLGISLRDLMGDALFAKNESFIRSVLAGTPRTLERSLMESDGNVGHIIARYIPDVLDGVVRGFFVLVSDVTELKTIQMELERRIKELDILAATDPLTGLANRRSFFERIREEIALSCRYGSPLTFLELDVDHFKAVNDSHGHDIGDEVLKTLAEVLKREARSTDFVGRLGGEEFGALLPHTDLADARIMAERLRLAMRSIRVRAGDQEIRFTVSIGLAAFSDEMTSEEELLKRADTALYRAKATGRDRVCLCQEA